MGGNEKTCSEPAEGHSVGAREARATGKGGATRRPLFVVHCFSKRVEERSKGNDALRFHIPSPKTRGNKVSSFRSLAFCRYDHLHTPREARGVRERNTDGERTGHLHRRNPPPPQGMSEMAPAYDRLAALGKRRYRQPLSLYS